MTIYNMLSHFKSSKRKTRCILRKSQSMHISSKAIQKKYNQTDTGHEMLHLQTLGKLLQVNSLEMHLKGKQHLLQEGCFEQL